MAKVTTESIPLSVLGKFPDDWDESTLADVCTQVTDGTHDSPKPVVSGGYPLVTGKAIKNRQIDFSVTYNISDEDHQKVISRSKANIDDILFSNIGNSIGDLVRVNTTAAFSIKNVALFKPDQSKVTPRFLEYYLLSELVQNFIKSSTRGSAQLFIGLGSLRGFPIALPPLGEQVEIGSLLGALDDRIALLRETNATLEAIAQALFKSWFVDFDPVHAKARGEPPHGMDDATAALFPDSFEESELGMIPKGWRVESVYSIADFINGASYKAFEPNALRRGLPIIKIAELKAGVTAQTGFSDLEMPEKYRISSGEILFSWSGNPDTSIDTFVWSYDDAWLNQHIFKVVPAGSEERAFVLLALKYLKPVFTELARNKQTTGLGHVTVADLKRLQIVKPTPQILAAWNEVVAPVIDRAFTMIQQAQTLAQLRDTLLPKLISGQLRLPEAEALLAEELP